MTKQARAYPSARCGGNVLKYLSLFSGIEAATAAWHHIPGWQAVAIADIEKFPNATTAYHYPDVPNLGDVTQITEEQIAELGQIDLIVFGSPCQDLSVAGKRAGLQGERSGLFHDAVRIIGWARKHGGVRFALWENVPGAFSSNKGRDFAVVVASLAGVAHVDVPPKGWGTEGALVGDEGLVEWSTLDAQWFGVAQRRRRVFALADFGNWTRRPPILLEPEGLRGDLAPRREAGEGTAAAAESGTGAGGGAGGDGSGLAFGGNNCSGPVDVATAVNAHGGGWQTRLRERDVSHALRADGFDASEDGTGRGTPLVTVQSAPRCEMPQRRSDGGTDAGHGARSGDTKDAYVVPIAPPISFNWQDDRTFRAEEEVTNPLRACQTEAICFDTTQVRRLTPRECERLQGFKDDYTLIPFGKKLAADGPRYKALGNSMAVPVMRWIGEQIDFALWCEENL